MSKQLILTTLLVFLFSISYTQAQTADASSFGTEFEVKKVMTYDKFVKKMAKKDELQVTVKGTVSAVCQMKGCWMNIVSDDPNQKTTVVKFKDYGFFVPKDISGQTVIMKGKGYKEVTSVEELRHYAEDAGKSKKEIEAITQPKEELKFEATGVIVLK